MILFSHTGKFKVFVIIVQCSLVKPPLSVQSVVWRYNKFGDNLLDDKQRREIISYAKENPKLTQQQIADNLKIKWDLFILMSLYKCNDVIQMKRKKHISQYFFQNPSLIKLKGMIPFCNKKCLIIHKLFLQNL
jgi:ABC-type iron transport system FetAB ATPase subunit